LAHSRLFGYVADLIISNGEMIDRQQIVMEPNESLASNLKPVFKANRSTPQVAHWRPWSAVSKPSVNQL
jgi:hypothetical protein